MPIRFRDLTRDRTVAADRAADFGADQPYCTSGNYETPERRDAFVELLRRRSYLEHLQINVEPLARSVPALLRDTGYLMTKFAHWWGSVNPIPVIELDGPNGTSCCLPERGWFEFFYVVAPVEANHGNHAHILVREELTSWDEHMLAKLGRRLGLEVSVSRNNAAWLAKMAKFNVTSHKSRIEYVVDHIRRRGSDLRFSASQMPEWVWRARAA